MVEFDKLQKIQNITIRKIKKIINIEWTNNLKICKFFCGSQNLERQNVERPIF